MTEIQEQTLRTVTALLKEHFEAGVIILETEDLDLNSEREIRWHGGFSRCLGLLGIATIRMLEKPRKEE